VSDSPRNDGGVVLSTPPLVEMRNITKCFGTLLANDRISLTLNRGEVLGLLGENGAGKSTLMKILYGLYSRDSGEIFVDGQEVKISSPQEAARLGIGMVHQEFMLVPTISVADNIVLGAETGNAFFYDSARASREVQELSKKFGLGVNPEKKVSELSVGLQQRVEILKALYRNARILILDEPTSVLIPQEVDELFRVLHTFVDQGLSIIFITHKLGEVLKVCDRIAILRDGKLVDTIRSEETNRSDLARKMVGRDVVLRVNREETSLGKIVLELKNVGLNAPGVHIPLKELNLTVRSGEIVGVAGVDGNGQKELGDVLAGIRRPTTGSIWLDDRDISDWGPKGRYKSGIAFIPEDRKNTGLVGMLTVSENIVLRRYDQTPFSKHGWFNSSKVETFAQQLVNEFDVRPRRIRNEAIRLSGGNQQKVILARELSGQPRVIIAAQPTRGLDVGAIEFVHTLLLRERNRGAAIILISFELDEIRSLANRIVVMHAGSIIGEALNGEVTDEQIGLWMAGIHD
jgi:general nucleoside transport system ATP-binding protein